MNCLLPSPPRIRRRLAALLREPLCLLAAPAGFGKFSALEAALGEVAAGPRYCLSLSLRRLPEDLPPAFREHLGEAALPPDAVLSAELLAENGLPGLLAALARLPWPFPVFLLLDLTRWEEPPQPLLLPADACPRFHAVLLARQANLPGTPTLAGNEWLLTREELAAAFAAVGLPLSAGQEDRLQALTGGVFLPAALAAELLRRSGRLPEIAQPSLLPEALFAADPATARVLSCLSGTSRLTAADLPALFPGKEEAAAKVLDGCPLLRREPGGTDWILHPLLCRFLAQRPLPPEAARTAAWHLRAGRDAAAAEICRQAGQTFGLSFEPSRLAGEELGGQPYGVWLRQMPLPREPLALLRLGLLHYGEGDGAAYEACLRAARPLCAGTDAGEWQLAAMWQAFPDLPEMTARARRAAALLGGQTSRLYRPELPFCFGCLSMAELFYREPGQAEETLRALTDWTAVCGTLTGGRGSGAPALLRGELCLLRGDIRRAELLAYEAESLAVSAGDFTLAAGAAWLLGRAALLRGAREETETIRRRIPLLLLRQPDAGRAVQAAIRRAAALLAAELSPAPLSPATEAAWRRQRGAPDEPLGIRLLLAGYEAEGNDRKTAGFLASCLEESDRTLPVGTAAHLQIHQALCCQRLSQPLPARTAYEAALALSRPDRLYLPPAVHVEELSGLLAYLEPGYEGALQAVSQLRESLERAKILPPAGEEGFPRSEPLTKREKEIAALAARGLRTREIAASLFLSRRTVENRLYTIYQKLRIGSRAELIQRWE